MNEEIDEFGNIIINLDDALIDAIGEERTQLCNDLIDSGACVNRINGNFPIPIHVAAIIGYPDTIELLINLNADIDAVDEVQATALHRACEHDKLIAIDLLINHGSNINLIDIEGNTPLHYAAESASQESCDYLIKHGANLHAKNFKGEEPKDLSIKSRNEKTLSFFENIDLKDCAKLVKAQKKRRITL